MTKPQPPIDKDPDEVILRAFDWTKASDQHPSGFTIVASEWIEATGGLALTDNGFSGLQTQVKLSGGIAGQSYTVINRITTASGLVLEQALPPVNVENTGASLQRSC